MLSSAANVWINNKRKAVEACFCGSADDACCQRQQLVGVRKKEGEENVAAVEEEATLREECEEEDRRSRWTTSTRRYLDFCKTLEFLLLQHIHDSGGSWHCNDDGSISQDCFVVTTTSISHIIHTVQYRLCHLVIPPVDAHSARVVELKSIHHGSNVYI